MTDISLNANNFFGNNNGLSFNLIRNTLAKRNGNFLELKP